MARYAAEKALTRRGRYWPRRVRHTRERRHAAEYAGEFAQTRVGRHAKFLNDGGFGDWSQVFRSRTR